MPGPDRTWPRHVQNFVLAALSGLDLAPARLAAGIDAEDHQPERDGDEQSRAQRRSRELEQRPVDTLRLLRAEADSGVDKEPPRDTEDHSARHIADQAQGLDHLGGTA